MGWVPTAGLVGRSWALAAPNPEEEGGGEPADPVEPCAPGWGLDPTAGGLSTTVGELSVGGGAAAADEHRPVPDDTSAIKESLYYQEYF